MYVSGDLVKIALGKERGVCEMTAVGSRINFRTVVISFTKIVKIIFPFIEIFSPCKNLPCLYQTQQLNFERNDHFSYQNPSTIDLREEETAL